MLNKIRFYWLMPLAFTLLLNPIGIRSLFGDETSSGFVKQVLPFLNKHCVTCHGSDDRQGDFRIDTLSRDFAVGASLDHWLEVVEKIKNGEMPPQTEANLPTAEERLRIVEWITAQIRQGVEQRLARRDRVSFHRLTREEYANTIYDLLGIRFDFADPGALSKDDDWEGFERIGSVLTLSPVHMERYIKAADTILAEAFPGVLPEAATFRQAALDLGGGPRKYGRKVYELLSSDSSSSVRVDLWPKQEIRFRFTDEQFRPAGLYRFRVQVSGLQATDGRRPHLCLKLNSVDRILYERDVFTSEDKPIVLEFEAHLPKGVHEFTLVNEIAGPAILSQLNNFRRKPFYSLDKGRIPWQLQLLENGQPLFPCLIVDWVELSGPLNDQELSNRRQHYLSKSDKTLNEACDRLAAFAEKAYRRPLAAEEIEKFKRLVQTEIASGASIWSSAKTGLLAILCSPEFLFLVEGSPEHQTTELNDWELASRLSYFLWSTMPDDTLFQLASKNQLHHPEVLRSQVRRMLADPRSSRFSAAFSRQWLQLNKVGMFPPDSQLYPEYDKYLERSMVLETTQFFEEVLKQNLSLGEFIDSDWTMLNARMATHYGTKTQALNGFRRVKLTQGDHRGGILTHASVLSLTSDGTRHRPVHRGVWISQAIFGEAPPSPPVNVDPIEPNPVDSRKTSLRERLKAHTSNPTCAACHRKIDPLGLAFDNYDAIGQWRAREAVPTGVGEHPTVDASGTMPDGRSFSSPDEFQQLLLDDIDKFNESFVKKLATFALRRTMTVDDQTELEAITRLSKSNDCRLRDLIEALVMSNLFRSR